MTNFKAYRSGTHRSATPTQTLSRIEKFLPVIGITRVSNITGLDKIGIPVVTAIRPNSKALATSQGKGLTLESAKVSALMESIESYHAENIFNETINISYDDISLRENTIDICGIARSYNNPFDVNEKILWLKGVDLISKIETWVPYESVSTDYSSLYRTSFLISDSNGLSSGNTMQEGIIHALCEIIERDALSLFFHYPNKYEFQKLMLETINESNNKNTLNLLEEAGIKFGIWDITTDIGIPTYICQMIDQPSDWGISSRPAYGSGTHLNKDIALSRAITEAAQSRATFIAGARDDQPKSKYEDSFHRKTITQWAQRIDAPNYKNFQESISIEHDTFEEDINFLLQSLSSAGITQAVCVDLTKKEFNIPVCKIIIPHLEGITRSDDRAVGSRIQRGIQ